MIDEYIPINQLEEGETYDQVFLLADVQQVTARKGGKRFVKFVVQDVTGTVTGVVWDLRLKANGSAMSAGKFIRLQAHARQYHGKISLSVQKDGISPYHGEPPNLSDYVPGPNDSTLDVYREDVQNFIAEIEDAHVRDLIGNAESRVDLLDMLRNAPYKLDGSLAHRGGLLMFVALLLKMSQGIMDHSGWILTPESINRSLVYAGCILRNIGWATTTAFSGRIVRPLDSYYMVGPHASSMKFVNHLFIHAESDLNIKIPEGKKQVLENMCVTDRSQLRSIEGYIVMMAEVLVQDLHAAQSFMDQRSDSNGWTSNGDLFCGHLRNDS